MNEHGVVAGLTNQPSADGRDPTKRSRGELPLLLTRPSTAGQAVAKLVCAVSTADYNPAWLLVGDRQSLFLVDMTGAPAPRARRLSAGVHVLENRPLGAPSAKVARVLALLAESRAAGVSLVEALPAVLADHTIPDPTDYSLVEPEAPAAARSFRGGLRAHRGLRHPLVDRRPGTFGRRTARRVGGRRAAVPHGVRRRLGPLGGLTGESARDWRVVAAQPLGTDQPIEAAISLQVGQIG